MLASVFDAAGHRAPGVIGALAEIAAADDYSRISAVLALRDRMAPADWFTVLGVAWTRCDNLGQYWPVLRQQLAAASRANLDCMMKPYEQREFDSLPELVPVYRGCYEQNVDGLSWSLDRQTAMKIPFYSRYFERRPAVLLNGLARRERSVLKLERDEREIVSTEVEVLAVTPIWREYQPPEEDRDATVRRVLARLEAAKGVGRPRTNCENCSGGMPT